MAQEELGGEFGIKPNRLSQKKCPCVEHIETNAIVNAQSLNIRSFDMSGKRLYGDMTREEFEVWKNYNDRKMLQEWIDAEKAGLQSKKTTAAMCQLFFKAPQSFYDDYLGIATIIVDGVEQRINTSLATECKRLGIKPPTNSVLHDFYYNTNVTWEGHTFQYLEEPNQFFDAVSKPRTIKVRKTLFQRIFE